MLLLCPAYLSAAGGRTSLLDCGWCPGGSSDPRKREWVGTTAQEVPTVPCMSRDLSKRPVSPSLSLLLCPGLSGVRPARGLSCGSSAKARLCPWPTRSRRSVCRVHFTEKGPRLKSHPFRGHDPACCWTAGMISEPGEVGSPGLHLGGLRTPVSQVPG